MTFKRYVYHIAQVCYSDWDQKDQFHIHEDSIFKQPNLFGMVILIFLYHVMYYIVDHHSPAY